MGNCQLSRGKDLFVEATAGPEDGGAKGAGHWQQVPVMFADGKRISVSVQRRTPTPTQQYGKQRWSKPTLGT
jgi:hypothetical protein